MRNDPSRSTGNLAHSSGTARLHLAASGFALMAALLCAPKAHATIHDICTVNGSDTTVAHVVGTFRDDMKNNDFLTDWIDIHTPNAWTCTRTMPKEKPFDIKVGLKALMIPKNNRIQDNFSFDGETYSIYRSVAGVGFIMARRYRIQAPGYVDWTSQWLPVTRNNQDLVHHSTDNYHLSLPGKMTYTVSIESRIRLLKQPHSEQANQFPKTGTAIEFEAAEWVFWRANDGNTQPRRHLKVRAWFNHEDKTCTTPSSVTTVRMQDVGKDAFHGVGTVAGTTGFNLELIGCDHSIKGIQYKLTPVGFAQSRHQPTVLETTPWPLSPQPGTLPLGAGSTATGIRLQILDENGNPVAFDRTSRLAAKNYRPGDSSATISLQAQYLQTGQTVTPGKVRGTMSVLYMYK